MLFLVYSVRNLDDFLLKTSVHHSFNERLWSYSRLVHSRLGRSWLGRILRDVVPGLVVPGLVVPGLVVPGSVGVPILMFFFVLLDKYESHYIYGLNEILIIKCIYAVFFVVFL
jgi:hypothetical protein